MAKISISPIEWTDYSCNPILIECYHKCSWENKPYCYMYSKGFYNRFKRYTNLEKLIQSESDIEKLREKINETYKDTLLDLNCLKSPYKRKAFVNQTIFVGSGTDIFGNWIPTDWIAEIFEELYNLDESNTIIILSKNSKRLIEFESWFKKNFIVGVTLETDLTLKNYETQAQSIDERITVFQMFEIHSNIMVSIEPILKFSENFLETILEFVQKPKWIVIGFNSCKVEMQYPTKNEVKSLIEDIEAHNQNWDYDLDNDNSKHIEVMIKPNLQDHFGFSQEFNETFKCYPIKWNEAGVLR